MGGRGRWWRFEVLAAVVLCGCFTVPEADEASDSSGGVSSSASAGGSMGGETSDVPLECDPDQADCDSRPENGCEVSLLDDEEHCGACDHSCQDTVPGPSACIDGQCIPQCSGGFADCDLEPSNGCEQSLDEPAHCGDCGRDCGDSECSDEGFCLPTLLVTGLQGPQAIALWDDMMYVCDFNAGAVVAAPVEGGAPVPRVTGLNGCAGLATDGEHLFIGEYGASTLRRTTLQGGDPVALYESPGVHGVWLQGQQVYWTAHDSGEVFVAPKDGTGQPQQLASGLQRPVAVAVDGTSLLYTDFGAGLLYEQFDQSVDVLSQGHLDPFYVGFDADYVYFAEASRADASRRQVLRLARSGDASPEVIARPSGPPSGIAVDEAFVYFSVESGGVLRLPR